MIGSIFPRNFSFELIKDFKLLIPAIVPRSNFLCPKSTVVQVRNRYSPNITTSSRLWSNVRIFFGSKYNSRKTLLGSGLATGIRDTASLRRSDFARSMSTGNKVVSELEATKQDGDSSDGTIQSYVHVTDFKLAMIPNRGLCESSNSCLVVLNYHIPKATPHLWEQSSIRVCGDGGANRLHKELPLLLPDKKPDEVNVNYIPEVIVGDLDSVDKDMLQFYQDRGTRLVNQHQDQDCNDLHKSLRFLNSSTPVQRMRLPDGTLTNAKNKVFVIGGLGGRLDHEFANLNALFLFPDLPVVLISDRCLLTLLPPGRNRIIPDMSVEGPVCGLVPLSGPAVVSTQGLRWNLDKSTMNFGGLISTSNEIASTEVIVETDQPLVWTTETTSWDHSHPKPYEKNSTIWFP